MKETLQIKIKTPMKLITKKICMTKDIGIHGNVFGGILMSWIDEAAAAKDLIICCLPATPFRNLSIAGTDSFGS